MSGVKRWHPQCHYTCGYNVIMPYSQLFSPLRHSPHLTRSPCTPLSHESLCLNNSLHESAEPLRPEVCFHHMWTETLSSTREGLSVGMLPPLAYLEVVCQRALRYICNIFTVLNVMYFEYLNANIASGDELHKEVEKQRSSTLRNFPSSKHFQFCAGSTCLLLLFRKSYKSISNS